ncbi:DUF3617 domain-containing protein [Sphingopyxis fribergensis]
MTFNSLYRSVAAPAALLAALAGCDSGPAGEEPIILAPGNYFITTSQELAGTPAADYDPMGSLDLDVCVRQDEAVDFPKEFARSYVVAGGCELKAWAREGNAFRGISACPVSGQAAITMNLEFEGVVSAGRIEILGHNNIHIPDSLRATADPAAVRDLERSYIPMSRLEFRYAAKRTGDCEPLATPFKAGR